jgi:hypothetical protein
VIGEEEEPWEAWTGPVPPSVLVQKTCKCKNKRIGIKKACNTEYTKSMNTKLHKNMKCCLKFKPNSLDLIFRL